MKRYVAVSAVALIFFLLFRMKLLPFQSSYEPAIPIQRYNKIRGSNIGQYSFGPLSSLPSHRRHPKARNMRIHFLNHHFGTTSEMKAIAHAVGKRNRVQIELTETRGIFEVVQSLYVSKEASNAYWPTAQKVECNANKYDMIIVGDTISLIRPHLQNCCPLTLVSLLTTRFDWAHDQDSEWTNLIVNASRWSNFRIYPNNLIEPWYASWKEADIVMNDYLPSSGIPTDLWTEAMHSINFTLPKAKDNELVVPFSVRTSECLTDHLQDRKIDFTLFERNRYGGPLGLTDRIVVHFPYQSNTMSLFENLHQRVIYVLPSLRLFREMGLSCKARLEKIPSFMLTDEEFYTKVDWWRRDLQHLFFYFDSFDDLKQGSTFRKQIVLEADHKRALISEYMIRQREYVLEKWEEIFFDQWTNEGHTDGHCQLYREQQLQIA